MRASDLLDPMYLIQRRHLVGPYLAQRARELAAGRHSMLLAMDRWATRMGLPLTANSRRLTALRNKHAGRRCVVIGNGPSLRTTDLELLKDEITIASNKIYLAFNETTWRPTYYTAIDGMVLQNIPDVIATLPFPKVLPRGMESLVGQDAGNSMFCSLLRDWQDVGEFHPGFSADLRDGAFGGESVSYFNLQVAYHLGCREIYLIGVDFSFTLPSKRTADAGSQYILEGEGEQNHFIKGYRPAGEKWTMPHLHEQEIAFRCARDFMQQRGGVIYNASRKSELTVFPRANFDDVFSG